MEIFYFNKWLYFALMNGKYLLAFCSGMFEIKKPAGFPLAKMKITLHPKV